jgi:diaminopimelate epimerase
MSAALRDLLPGDVPFWKMSGSGNDFVMIDDRAGRIPDAALAPLARSLCRRRLSIGADGIVLIQPAPPDQPAPSDGGPHLRWRYINADGSEGEMCGNGAMCGARFAHLVDAAPADLRLLTPSGIVAARVAADPTDPRVQIAVGAPGPVRHAIRVDVAGLQTEMSAIQVGVPHAVLITHDADAFPGAGGPSFIEYGRAVRHADAFAPAGTNLNVVTVRDRSTIRMRTYERGVEDETLACGTGAIASAIVATSLGLVAPPVAVIVSSGRTLRVDFTGDPASGPVAEVTLGGEARIVSHGVVGPDAWT